MSTPQNLYPELQLFIGGEWISKGARQSESVLNPATGEVLGELPHATTADLDRALAAAEKGFKVWRSYMPEKRGEILRKAAALLNAHGDRITRVASMESGKAIAQSRIELHMATEVLEWYAEEGRRAYGRVLTQRQPGTRHLVVKQPIGRTVIIIIQGMIHIIQFNFLFALNDVTVWTQLDVVNSLVVRK